jgi:cytochrome c biogenesis protein CcmG/thiol:disulfide interchange protein DsbE
MIRKLFYIGILLLVSSYIQAQIPSATVENMNGSAINVRDAVTKGKITVISFWSSVCKPCLAELDAISDVIDSWHKKADFDMIAVTIDDNRNISTAKSLVNGHGWNFTILFDKNQNMKRAFGVNFIPHVFIFDAGGKQVYSHTGYTPGSENELLDKIVELAKH